MSFWKVFNQYKYAKEKYSNYELLKTIYKKIYKEIYHSIMGEIRRIYPVETSNEKFEGFSPSNFFFFTLENKDDYIKYLKQFELSEEIIVQANEICSHYFNLLGSGRTYLGEKINWHKDFKSGFVWEKHYFYKTVTVNLLNNSDVKVPWELSRFQHIPTLGQGYWLSSNEKYAEEFKSEIEDWIKENPVSFGVNWACPMDVSIRAVNWIIGYYYFKNSKVIDESFWTTFFKQLYLTGEYIFNNLECYINGHGNNHYLTDLVGLTWLGIFFNGTDKTTIKWLNKGIDGICEEMKYQVNSEGTDFEASIPYHRLVTEMLLSTTILGEINNIKFPNDFKETLEKMCEFVMFYTKDNGLAPQIGDADDGRLHIFTHYGIEEKRDHRHILGIAGEYFNRDDFRYFSGSEKMDAVWLLGTAKQNYYKCSRNNLITKSYEQMGYYIIRDNRIFIIIRCGNMGQAGIGGHSHNDQLSLELQIDGQDIFIDPGTYLYTADYKERNLFRSTAYHNTLKVLNDEQNPIEDQHMFRLFDNTKSKLISFEQSSNEVIFIAEHSGYFEKYGVIYNRKIIYNLIEKKIKIIDSINKAVESKIYWILNDNTTFKVSDNNKMIINNNIEVHFDNPFQMEDTFISPQYGKKVKSNKILVNLIKSNVTTIQF